MITRTGRISILGPIAVVFGLALLWACAQAAFASSRVSPLPRSAYGIRAVCAKPARKRAGCLALQLVPKTAEAQAHTHPLGVRRAALATPSAPPSPAAGDFGLRPQDLHSAYQLPTSASSAQTIALVDAYNDLTAEEDLATYDKEFGLPECTAADGCFEKVNQNGEAGSLPFPRSASELEAARKGSPAARAEAREAIGWALEISLDIETAHATCQSCHILLVESNAPSYEDLERAEQSAATLGANEVSNSWAGPEEGETPALESASPFNHPGVVIAAAAGDEGYLNWDASSRSERGYASFPASSPHVVAVGGTRLSLGEGGAWAGEAVWNGDGAGGGGCTVVFAAPPWQQSVSDWPAVGCAGKRAVADVAADADPYTGVAVYDSSPECEYKEEGKAKWVGHWCTIGGTSLATPLIASVFALAGGANGVAYPAATLYENEARSSGSLHDITLGSNGECTKPFTDTGLSGCTPAEEAATSCASKAICLAGTGYDGPSGVGTPDGIGAFTAPSTVLPAVTTGAASSITQSTAIVNASVNPNGEEVGECKLEYGTSTSYGSSAPCSPSPGSGSAPVAVSASLTGLTASTTYYFRVVASNAGGTGYGGDETFETLVNPPEFGRCVKVAKGAGKYASSTCASLGGTHGYEWDPGVLQAASTIKITSGPAILRTSKGALVTCSGETGTGQYTGPKTVGGIVLTLVGCELSGGEQCSSAVAPGEVVSSSLEGVLGIEKLGASASRDKAGLDLFPAGQTGPVMEFSCGATTVSITGSVIVPVKANKMALTQTLKFKAKQSAQKPENFVSGPEEVLEASLAHASPEQIGLTLTATLLNGEAVEINTVA